MGQYYVIANIDKKQFINPHVFGDGIKLLEFGASGCGAMTGLAVLLANSNNRGGGDLRSDNKIIGSWAGDRIVVAGDYAEMKDPGEGKVSSKRTLYMICHDPQSGDPDFKDISMEVVSALAEDEYIAQNMASALTYKDNEDMKAYPKVIYDAFVTKRMTDMASGR